MNLLRVIKIPDIQITDLRFPIYKHLINNKLICKEIFLTVKMYTFPQGTKLYKNYRQIIAMHQES